MKEPRSREDWEIAHGLDAREIGNLLNSMSSLWIDPHPSSDESCFKHFL